MPLNGRRQFKIEEIRRAQARLDAARGERRRRERKRDGLLEVADAEVRAAGVALLAPRFGGERAARAANASDESISSWAL